MNTKKFNLIITFVICLIILAGCGKTEQKTDKEVIKIGAILPLTGKLSVMGEVEKNAMTLAAEDINKDKKIIEIVFEDGKGTPKDAVTAAQKLIDIDNVDVIITSTTGASLAVEPITTGKKKNLIAFCMDPDISLKSPYVMRYYIGVNDEAQAINKYFQNDTKAKKVGILYAKVPALEKVINDTYIPYLKDLKVEIPFVESYEIGEKDFKTAVAKLKNSNIDHLIILGYGFEYPNIFTELQQSQLLDKIKILGGWGFLYTQVNQELLEGVLVSGPDYVFKKKEIAGEFYQAYFNRYKTYPNFDAAFSYNLINSIATNVKKGDFANPLKDFFIKKNDLNGVVGKYSFTSDGNMTLTTGLGIYRNGQVVEYTH